MNDGGGDGAGQAPSVDWADPPRVVVAIGAAHAALIARCEAPVGPPEALFDARFDAFRAVITAP